jgi:hypothetical protein
VLRAAFRALVLVVPCNAAIAADPPYILRCVAVDGRISEYAMRCPAETRAERTHIVNVATKDGGVFSRQRIALQRNTKPGAEDDVDTPNLPENAPQEAPETAKPAACEHCTEAREERQSFRRRR